MVSGAAWLHVTRRGPQEENYSETVKEHTGWLPGTCVVVQLKTNSQFELKDALGLVVGRDHDYFDHIDAHYLNDDDDVVRIVMSDERQGLEPAESGRRSGQRSRTCWKRLLDLDCIYNGRVSL